MPVLDTTPSGVFTLPRPDQPLRWHWFPPRHHIALPVMTGTGIALALLFDHGFAAVFLWNAFTLVAYVSLLMRTTLWSLCATPAHRAFLELMFHRLAIVEGYASIVVVARLVIDR